MRIVLLSVTFVLLSSGSAWGYVGPGLGLGAIGAVFGAVVAVFLGIMGLVWYPVKRLMKKMKNKEEQGGTKS